MNTPDWERFCEFAAHEEIHNDETFSEDHRKVRRRILLLDRMRRRNSLWRSGILDVSTKLVLAKAWKYLYRSESEWESIYRVQDKMRQLVRAIQSFSIQEQRVLIRKLPPFDDVFEMMIQEVAVEQMTFALDMLHPTGESTFTISRTMTE